MKENCGGRTSQSEFKGAGPPSSSGFITSYFILYSFICHAVMVEGGKNS